ncbi:fructose-1,6-bisphosphatase [Campylobacter sp. RM12640]|uniref:class 1 fructose-bisphosphatase n=1 Tax=unclassified Campylobacter TaxID=2593542 RepID=UPI0030150C52|nr:fructose-1,6-bisphosphatase [Campylobacter sp. RM12640]MBZ7988865.1 fructose-1,6-bisphosphatase [Campylobacter sp. RM12635]
MQEIIEAIKQSVLKIKQSFDNPEYGYTELSNASGDLQLKQDVLSDMIITNELSKIGSIKAIISEEKENPQFLYDDAKYIVAYDPLDGSSLFDVNFTVGSIFAIYENTAEPNSLKAAIYSIYGPRTQLVVCINEPKLYEYDGKEFKFLKDLKLNEKGKLNATGGTQKDWSKAHKAMIDKIFSDGYRLRYSGAMVSDLHQILIKGGGLFSYPNTSEATLNDGKLGKLRALFEVFPFAYIYEKAGGFSSDGIKGSKGYESLLNLKFSTIHASTPCYLGSISEKAYLDEYL